MKAKNTVNRCAAPLGLVSKQHQNPWIYAPLPRDFVICSLLLRLGGPPPTCTPGLSVVYAQARLSRSPLRLSLAHLRKDIERRNPLQNLHLAHNLLLQALNELIAFQFLNFRVRIRYRVVPDNLQLHSRQLCFSVVNPFSQ